jgi:NADH-quinone oxidoreductase subunit M
MSIDRLLLLALVFLPALAAIAAAALGARRAAAIRWLSLGTAVTTLLLALILALEFQGIVNDASPDVPKVGDKTPTFRPEIVPGAADNRHATTWSLLEFRELGAIQFYIGLDGLNVWLVVLTALLLFSSVLISWNAIQERVPEYYAWLLVLGTGMIGVFVAFDIILFYIFFEFTLVPLFFLIGIWGGPERRLAARKFFIYTLSGSLITLLGVLAVVAACYQVRSQERDQPGAGGPNKLTFAIPELVETVNKTLERRDRELAKVRQSLSDVEKGPEPINQELADSLRQKARSLSGERRSWQSFQLWVFLALMAGFAIKVPLVPLHTWLPLAHVEAPTAGSVLLAGILLKIGAYGILRLCLPLAPDASIKVGVPLIGAVPQFGII